MRKSFTQMTGYEFEDYIANLFKNMGFRVTQTDYSGDGGIDMYLYYERPIFKGMYVVQCKNYKGLVGQPEIRDLYGVVMSESANKGIIITTSDFTEQAFAFADGKNLELINGQTLNWLISKTDFDNSEDDNKLIIPFMDYEGFNNKRYTYLKNKIDNQPTETKNYEEMIRFLREYILHENVSICQAGLLEELISYIHMYRDRCFKTKSKIWGRELCSSLEAEIRLMLGDLAEAMRILCEIGKEKYYIRCNDIGIWLNYGHHKEHYELIGQNHDRTGSIVNYLKNAGYAALKMNLLFAFKMIGYNRGMESILNHVKHYDSVEEYINNEYKKGRPCLSNDELFEVYTNFMSGKYDDVFFFIRQYVKKNKYATSGYSIDQMIEGVQSASTIRHNYYIKDDITIKRELDEMFDSLGL